MSDSYEELKSLILNDEAKRVSELEQDLDAILTYIKDPSFFKAHFDTLFDDLFKEHISQKDSRVKDALADHFSNIVSKSIEQDLLGLRKSLSAVIAPAIKEQIEKNSDEMIDALYPILGGMISKYVSQSIKQMTQKIEKRIQTGLSWRRYLLKLKSKLSGVSESEILLEQSMEQRAKSIFVIHKQSGLLVAEASCVHKEIKEPEMVASMASAIRSFVLEWIEGADDRGEREDLSMVSYGNSTLYIESAGSVLFVAFFDEEPDFESRAHVNELFSNLMLKYGDYFSDFDGKENKKIRLKIEEKIRENLM